jgi:hypothetical protein
MAIPSANAALCLHLRDAKHAAFPFDVELALDDQSGFTDAVVTCRTCGQHVLLEMLEWGGARYEARIYRASLVPANAVALYLKDRARGSCDVKRAGAEAHAFTSLAQLTSSLVALDLGKREVTAVVSVPAGTDVPMDSWRVRLTANARPIYRDYFTRSSTRIE